MSAVFDYKRGGESSNELARRYRIGARDRETVAECVDDWIVYRESGRSGGRGYVAIARVAGIEPHPSMANQFYALVDQYLDFTRPVPLRWQNVHVETAFRKIRSPKSIGVAAHGKPVRPLTPNDFKFIVGMGLGDVFDLGADHAADESDLLPTPTSHYGPGFSDEPRERLNHQLSNPLKRDRAFRKTICQAYHYTCAVTGFHLVDDDIVEVEAAHIVPVASNGSDWVRNGIALTRSVHWIFDRHLISISEDGELLIAPHLRRIRLIDAVFINLPVLNLPREPWLRPHPEFLAQHRAIFRSKLPA